MKQAASSTLTMRQGFIDMYFFVCRTVIQDTLFAVSPLHYSTLSFTVTVLVGMAVSFATGKYKWIIS